MKMNIILFLLAGSLAHTVYAQQLMTLEQCIEYAWLHQEVVKNAKMDQQIAAQKIKQSYTQLYPQVKGVVDVKDNLILPTNILPGSIAGLPADQTIALQFGQKYNATAALDANWILYDPTVLAGIKSLKQNEAISLENEALQKKNVRITVSKSYFAALIASEKIQFQKELLTKSSKTWEDAKVLFNQQQITQTDLMRAEWNVKNQEAEIQRSQLLFEQSIYSLQYQMGWSEDSLLRLQPISFTNYNTNAPTNGAPVGLNSRSDYKILQLQYTQEKLNGRRYKMSYLPILNAYGYLGTQAFRPEFDLLSSNTTWYGLSYVGLKLTVPVFDGLLKCRQIQESTLLKEKKQNEISALEKQYQYEVEYAQRAIRNAEALLEIRKNNIEVAKLQQQQLDVKYQQGLVTLKDLIDGNSVLAEAQQNYLVALQELLLAKLEYERVK